MTGIALQRPPIRDAASRRRLWLLAQENFDRGSEALLRRLYDGEIGYKTWHVGFKRLVKDLHVTQAVIGNDGDWAGMTAQMWGRIGPIVRRQYQFALRFALDLFDRAMLGQMPSFEYALWRMKLYGGVAEGSGRWIELATRGDPDDLMVWVRTLLDSCDVCIEREGMTVKRSEIAFVPRDGSTPCDGHCGCEWKLVE